MLVLWVDVHLDSLDVHVMNMLPSAYLIIQKAFAMDDCQGAVVPHQRELLTVPAAAVPTPSFFNASRGKKKKVSSIRVCIQPRSYHSADHKLNASAAVHVNDFSAVT
jgi:hypothetical protein